MAASAGGIVGSAQTDITNPYQTIPCGCLYCFVCLVQKLEGEEDEGWVCLRCGEIVKKCKPWNGDVLEEVHPPSNSGKAVGFAMDDEEEAANATELEGEDASPHEEPSLEEEELQHSKHWSTVDSESVDENEATEST